MPLISFAPGGPYNILPNDVSTIGPTTTIPPSGPLPPTSTPGLDLQPPQKYPAFGKLGLAADCGEVADALNQIVLRIQQIEQLLSINPIYGIVQQ